MGKARKLVVQPEHRSSRCKRRRKRTFAGNRYSITGSANEVVENQDVNTDRPRPTDNVNMAGMDTDNLSDHDHLPGSSSDGHVSTVTERKLSSYGIEITEEQPEAETESHSNYTQFSDNEIMDMGILSEVVACLACPECKHVGVKLLHEKRFGLATKCKMLCENCTYENVFWSSQKAETGRAFDINQRTIYAMRSIGVGLAGTNTFLSLMNLPPPVKCTAYDKLQKKVHCCVKEVATELMQDAVEELRCINIIKDVSISCDGTWQKRGFTSLNGAVIVISTDTGKVLDVEVMSRYCNACVKHEKIKVTDPAKYEQFMLSHKCGINHHGSAPAMEKDGAVNIFTRSIEKNKLRYVNFYGDGDTKSFSSVESIYPGIKVTKFECIGHVQKRMGKRLRTLKKKESGLGGTGRLNDAMVDKIQNYYGIAIRRNTGKDVQTMKSAIWGAFFHVASHVKKLPDGTFFSNEWHDHCEVGPNSWCKFQQDIANKTKTYIPGLPEDIIKHVKPILTDLSSDALLAKCLHGLTQNQNESFNGTVWNRIPKGTYVGLRQLEIGVYDAVAHFNIGSKAAVLVYEKLGMRPGQHMLKGCLSKNDARTVNARRQSTISKKLRRRYNRAAKKHKSDKTKIKEGKLYGAGAF